MFPARDGVMPPAPDQRDARFSRAVGGARFALPAVMVITLDSNEAIVLAEILASTLKSLRIESARTDSQSYREGLHERERLVEHMLELVTHEPRYDSPNSVL
jgi:hypothetical protein